MFESMFVVTAFFKPLGPGYHDGPAMVPERHTSAAISLGRPRRRTLLALLVTSCMHPWHPVAGLPGYDDLAMYTNASKHLVGAQAFVIFSSARAAG